MMRFEMIQLFKTEATGMTMQTVPFSSLSVSLGLLGAICEEEWQAYLEDYEILPVPERQDLRGFFLNWTAVFFPGAFAPVLTYEMAGWLNGKLQDDSLDGIAQVPLIGATLFAITGDHWWLRLHTSQFAYGGSLVRHFIHKSLTLVVPRISFDGLLLGSLDYGLKIPFFYMDTALALYVLSKGEPEQKIAQLKHWRERYFMNFAEADLVDHLIKDRLAPNPLQHWLLKGTSYVALRLGCGQTSNTPWSILPLGTPVINVWEHMMEHPSYAPYLSLLQPNSDGRVIQE